MYAVAVLIHERARGKISKNNFLSQLIFYSTLQIPALFLLDDFQDSKQVSSGSFPSGPKNM
jgi:hypothetical protein